MHEISFIAQDLLPYQLESGHEPVFITTVILLRLYIEYEFLTSRLQRVAKVTPMITRSIEDLNTGKISEVRLDVEIWADNRLIAKTDPSNPFILNQEGLEILPSGSIQIYDRYEEINGQEVDDLSEAIGAIQAGPDGDPDAAADNGVYIDFSEANPASAASSTNVNMFDLSEGDQTADVAVGGSSVDFAIESSGVGADGTVYVDRLDGGDGLDIAYAANAYTRLDQQNGEFDGIIIDLAEGTISFDDGGKLEVTNIEAFTATSLDDIIVGGAEYASYNSIQSFSPLGGIDEVWGSDSAVTFVGYEEDDSLGAQGVVIWTKLMRMVTALTSLTRPMARPGTLLMAFRMATMSKIGSGVLTLRSLLI